MKNVIVSIAVVGMFLQGPVYAEEGMSMDHTHSLRGPAIGALAGGILAGPPGLMTGLIGGALIGHIEAQKDQILHAGEELVAANEQLEFLNTQQAGEHARVLQQIQTNHTRLEAVTEGFSFCLGFRTESADIEPALQPHLHALAGMLNAFRELDIEVRASADRRGSENYNLELTKLRAEAVVRRLLEAGVSPDRIKMRISGEEAALYPETDPEGLGFDRYVVLSFVAGGAS
ncbi:MAG: OmpA family protein [Pseudomonadota bacterium]